MTWEKKKLVEVCDALFAGGDVPKGNFSKTLTEEYTVPIYSNGIKDRGLYGYTNKARVLEPSITISARGTIGHIELRIKPFFPIIRLIVATPNRNIFEIAFVKYALSLLEFKNTGVAIPQLTVPMVKNYEIPIPPLPEQKRIVSILDRAFADIEKARANAEQNLKNSRELFNSYLQKVFTEKGEGEWKSTELGEIASISSGGTPTKSNRSYWQGDIAWYASGELNQTYTTDSKELITNKGLNESNAKIFPEGSLLIGMYDTAALKMSILDRDGTFNQAIAGVRPNDKINLLFIMSSINFIKPELMKLRRGVRQKNLNQSKIKAIPIDLPSIEIQNSIVEKLYEIKHKTQNLESIYTKKLAALDELKKSILQKAFAGKTSVVDLRYSKSP